MDTPKVSLKVEFVDLWKSADYENMAAIEKVHLCDIVRVEFIRLGVSATAEVTKTEWDVLNERYSSIDIGEAKATLNDIVRSNVSRATAQISTDISSMKQDIKPKPVWQTHTGTKQVTLNDAVTTSLFTKQEMATILGIEEESVNNADTTVTAENKDETIKTAITGINYSANGWAVVFADKVTGTVTVGYTIKYLGG